MDDMGVRPPFSPPLRRGELVALDSLAAVAYPFVFLATPLATPLAPASGVPAWARALIVAGVGLPLAVRRLWPLPVFAAVLALSVVATLLDVVEEPFLAASVALYPVALTLPRPRREPTVVIGLVSVAVILLATVAGAGVGAPANLATVLLGCALMGGTWTVGRAARERRAYAARSAEQLAQRAAAEERLRIARELHDVVSHTLSLIGVKAAIGNHVAESRPEEARDALRVIEATSRAALDEMRHMLGVLRADPAPADLKPLPGLADLPELAERAALAGVRVDLDVRGVDRLPQGVELSIYRIVQEAVTNVVKHGAAAARCRAAVVGSDADVRIEVTDDGPRRRTAPRPPGHGLIGMRERVALHGGTFTAGPRPGGGFAVCARLPLAPSEERA